MLQAEMALLVCAKDNSEQSSILDNLQAYTVCIWKIWFALDIKLRRYITTLQWISKYDKSRPWLCSTRKRKRSDSVLWQKPLYQQKCQKDKVTTQTMPQKSSITQRLRTDLGRSVGVTTAIKLVWLTWFTAQPSHSPHQPCNQKDMTTPPHLYSKISGMLGKLDKPPDGSQDGRLLIYHITPRLVS